MANISYGVNIIPKTNNAYTLGNSDYKWANIYTVQINGTNVSDLGIDKWLERNDLDANITGKVNMLSTPYSMDDILQGKIIYANGSINDASNQCVSPLIPISAGTYGLKTSHNEYIGNINSGNSYKNGYSFFATDGVTTVARPENLLHSLGNDIYVFEVPDEAVYIRFCYVASGPNYYEDALDYFNQWILLPDADDNIDNSFFTVQQKKLNIEVDKLLRLDGSYASLKDTQARQGVTEALGRPITFGRKTCAIFEKVCCIGDSFTAGYIYNTSDGAHSDKNYSWVKHLEKATGREYVNCGISGATSKSWLTNTEGLAKAQLPENKAQAYIIALQINDAATGLTVGTVNDIGTSAETYYGCTSKIIDEMFAINDKAHIFLLTQPKNFVGEHTPYRAAILDIVEWYQNNGTHQNQVHLIDLLNYWQLFHNPGCYDSSANGHFTGAGWEYTAEIIMFAWSEYINAHPLLFQDVNLIPFSASLHVNDVQLNGSSIIDNGIANIPIATTSTLGLLKASGSGSGLQLDSSGYLKLSYPDARTIKAGSNLYAPVVVGIQHESVFYGLAKAAGDSTQSASSNAVGIYTTNAKTAIQNMLSVPSTDSPTFTGSFSQNRKANTTVGPVSAVIGYDNAAEGSGAIAMGHNNMAYAQGSIALGNLNTIYGDSAVAIGYKNIAQYQSSFVFGSYNAIDTITDWTSNVEYNVGDLVYNYGYVFECLTAHTSESTIDYSKWRMVLKYLFVIGNGHGENARSNALAVNTEGDLRLKNNLYVNCNADSSGGTLLAPIEVIRL